MNLYLLFIIIISLICIGIYIKNFNEDYLSKDNTTCIKGIFILIVFYSHISVIMAYHRNTDFLMRFTSRYLGQLMVAMFLFYSGYGIYESIKKKKENYINGLPKNRILKTLLHFDIAVLTFALVHLILGNKKTIAQILLSLTGWESIGNSNWYIFDILILYLTTFISFKIFKKDQIKAIISNWILTIVSMIVIWYFKKPGNEWWINTLLCYPLGMTYSYYKDRINAFLFKNSRYIISLIIVAVLFLVIKRFESTHVIVYCILSLVFSILVVLLTMKINLKSKILKWFGENLFWVYILQRIPMIIFKKTSIFNNSYIYFLVCFVVTIILTIVYKFVITKADNIIFKSY